MDDARAPLVVLDLSWIRAMKNGAELPGGFEYTIPEQLLYEAATTSDALKTVEKVWTILRSNRERIFIAKHWNHVADMESSPRQLVSRADLVYRPLRALISAGAPFDRERWCQELSKPLASSQMYERSKSHFESWRRDFAAALEESARAKGAGTFAQTPEADMGAAIRQSNAALSFLCHHYPKYDIPEWRNALDQFPDQHAIGRMARLQLWYTLRRTRLSAPDRIGNDWEDLHYAFLASYADQFWTRDKDLRDAVSLLFESTLVDYGTRDDDAGLNPRTG